MERSRDTLQASDLLLHSLLHFKWVVVVHTIIISIVVTLFVELLETFQRLKLRVYLTWIWLSRLNSWLLVKLLFLFYQRYLERVRAHGAPFKLILELFGVRNIFGHWLRRRALSPILLKDIDLFLEILPFSYHVDQFGIFYSKLIFQLMYSIRLFLLDRVVLV